MTSGHSVPNLVVVHCLQLAVCSYLFAVRKWRRLYQKKYRIILLKFASKNIWNGTRNENKASIKGISNATAGCRKRSFLNGYFQFSPIFLQLRVKNMLQSKLATIYGNRNLAFEFHFIVFRCTLFYSEMRFSFILKSFNVFFLFI